jgi:hypothetical protein
MQQGVYAEDEYEGLRLGGGLKAKPSWYMSMVA